MNIRSDRGFTLPELLVTISLLFLLLGAVFFALEGIEVSAQVSDRQAAFARDVSTPLHAMDKVLCQNKAILEGSGQVSDGYTLTSRSPVGYGTGSFTRHVYTFDEQGRFIEYVYRHTLTSTTATLIRTKVWSTNNGNRARGPAFTYLGADGNPTTPSAARSVVVEIWAEHEGRYYSGRRQIYFRNR